jgi:hypothetical protein
MHDQSDIPGSGVHDLRDDVTISGDTKPGRPQRGITRFETPRQKVDDHSDAVAIESGPACKPRD